MKRPFSIITKTIITHHHIDFVTIDDEVVLCKTWTSTECQTDPKHNSNLDGKHHHRQIVYDDDLNEMIRMNNPHPWSFTEALLFEDVRLIHKEEKPGSYWLLRIGHIQANPDYFDKIWNNPEEYKVLKKKSEGIWVDFDGLEYPHNH